MKIQDLGFLLMFALVFSLARPRLSVALGLFCLVLAMPLFAGWIFFTAERLTWYAAAFFALAILQILWEGKHAHRN